MLNENKFNTIRGIDTVSCIQRLSASTDCRAEKLANEQDLFSQCSCQVSIANIQCKTVRKFSHCWSVKINENLKYSFSNVRKNPEKKTTDQQEIKSQTDRC